jgi:hypothetical protein
MDTINMKAKTSVCDEHREWFRFRDVFIISHWYLPSAWMTCQWGTCGRRATTDIHVKVDIPIKRGRKNA